MVKTDRETLERYKTKALGWKKEVKLGKSDPITAYGPEETIAYSHYFFPSRLLRKIYLLDFPNLFGTLF